MPSRTIRFYQSKGALPRPQSRGRVAYYGPAHVERLKLIASLQDRGLRIDAIRDLTARIDKEHMRRTADDLAEYFFKHAREGFGRSATGSDFAAVFRELRPLGLEAVRVVFAQEMERVLRRLVESGKTATLPAKGKRAPRS